MMNTPIIRVAPDTELAGYLAAGYLANNFAGYRISGLAGYRIFGLIYDICLKIYF